MSINYFILQIINVHDKYKKAFNGLPIKVEVNLGWIDLDVN